MAAPALYPRGERPRPRDLGRVPAVLGLVALVAFASPAASFAQTPAAAVAMLRVDVPGEGYLLSLWSMATALLFAMIGMLRLPKAAVLPSPRRFSPHLEYLQKASRALATRVGPKPGPKRLTVLNEPFDDEDGGFSCAEP